MATEQRVQKSIISHLEKKGWFVIRLKVTNMSGMPDLLALKIPHAPFFIEVKKSKGGITSPLQKYMLKLLMKFGFIAIVANSWEVVEQTMIDEKIK